MATIRDAWNALRRTGALFSGLTLFALLLLWLIGMPRAADSLVFGPQIFERGAGKPEPVLLSFPAGDREADYALFFYNGAQNESAEADEWVSSSEILLNGEPIVGPKDLNQQIGFLAVTSVTRGQVTHCTALVSRSPFAHIFWQ